MFPPSPDWSDCDSLSDVDLDAFLDAQGQLSHFPTPPCRRKDKTIINENEIEVDEDDGIDYYHVARLFTSEASIGIAWDEIDIRMIERMLLRAALPPDVVALAFNILRGLDCHSLPLGSFNSAPNDLIVVSALKLAASYINDHPPTMKYWSRFVCDGAWTAARIDKTTIQVFGALGWRLHAYSGPDAIRTALSILTPGTRRAEAMVLAQPAMTGLGSIELKIAINGSSASWVNGQITPDGTPPAPGFGLALNENRYLRLL